MALHKCWHACIQLPPIAWTLAALRRKAGCKNMNAGMCVYPTAALCRLCFPHITAVTQRLIDTLSAAGPSVVHDMDAVAAAITVDVIGLAAFNRDLQATCTLPAAPHATAAMQPDATSAPTDQQTPVPDPAGTQSAASSNSTQNAGVVQESTGVSTEGASTVPNGICGSVAFPRGREVLEVISHLVVAMQARNNPLNRWFPWRQVRTISWGYSQQLCCQHCCCSVFCSATSLPLCEGPSPSIWQAVQSKAELQHNRESDVGDRAALCVLLSGAQGPVLLGWAHEWPGA